MEYVNGWSVKAATRDIRSLEQWRAMREVDTKKRAIQQVLLMFVVQPVVN